MRTNIDIDDRTLDDAMKAGAFKTKKDAVEAGLKLIVRQAAYREILKWEGKLHWDGDVESADEAHSAPTTGSRPSRAVVASECVRVASKSKALKATAPSKARHGRR